ncbi:hypothetical protein HZB08_01140 [Candidatus Saganbacteria bacterium]|uniref:Tetratricopeptide repeat protein n=1 Tax=Candidatus Saganbacteria bacterium TaxID=2575572 RepID=A0A9D6ULX5_UNCSA|nr:hypothetical protein [Candidatus Saganbacteria bacterium]
MSQKERGILYFFLALHRHDARARQAAENIFKKLNGPESRAYLGSIQTLKARDFAGGGALQAITNLTPLGFIRIGYVQSGAGMLDEAVKDNPDNFEIRLIRANTYLGLPSTFGRFKDGYKDMTLVLEWMEKGKIALPDEDEYFRDKPYVYYTAGEYFLRAGEADKAREMFLRSSALAPHSPYAAAARKRRLE